ncbi:MAG: PDZ domain-containing protein [Acidobacteriota bacterium]
MLKVAAVSMAVATLCAPPGAMAQLDQVKHFVNEVNPFVSHSKVPGYLGVLVGDVDNETASRLRLKDTHGAIITLIDHDAPAGQVGLHVSDVITSIDGQIVQNAEQFSQRLREYHPGRKITLAILRDGAAQSVTVELVDRKAMEQAVWNKMNNVANEPPPPSGMAILPGGNGGGGDASTGFHWPWFGSGLNVGAMVEPLTSQMADYLGVPSGVMVKQVTRKSEAASAGLRAYDVVLKVGNDPMSTTADWDRALRTNRGKVAVITILRERRQQTLNLQVDSKRK